MSFSHISTRSSAISGQTHSGTSLYAQARSVGLLTHLSNREYKHKTTFHDNTEGLENFLANLQLDGFFQLSEEQQEERLAKIDAIELFNALQEVNRELAFARLENHFLIDFLEKNDPKLLIGLHQHKQQTSQTGFGLRRDHGSAIDTTLAERTSRSMGSRSLLSRSAMNLSTLGITQSKKPTIEYKLNFRAKADMAEKTVNDVEKRVREIEKNAIHDIKILRGHIEELRFTNEEAKETSKSFHLHFLRDERDLAFLNTATERQLERKIRKFVNNWLKHARALLGTMRLRITSLHEQCTQLRNELMTKADLSGILTAIDFEKLMIKRTQLLNALEEKNTHMAGLKGVTGKASLSMSEEKQAMMSIEEESRQLNNKTLEVIKTITKLEREALLVEKENERDLQTLNNLKVQLERYEAPSVHEYLAKKNEVLMQEKEEKMLRRKIYILEMKLDNTQKKCKRRFSLSSIE